MGYYTAYSLSVIDAVSDKVAQEICEELKKLEVFDDWGDTVYDWWGHSKWYDYANDMALLSSRFPGVLFRLYGDGDDSEDFWVAYFKDGKQQFCPGTIVYDDFDESKMEDCKVVDSGQTYSCQSDV